MTEEAGQLHPVKSDEAAAEAVKAATHFTKPRRVMFDIDNPPQVLFC